MKKINKKILIFSTLSAAIIGTSVVLASCSSTATNSNDKDFNTTPFVQNMNKKFMDVNKGMDTIEIVKKLLTSSEGIKDIASYLGDELLFNWFKYNQIAAIKSLASSTIKDSEKVLEDTQKSYNNINSFQVNKLDPTGVTKDSYIQSNSLSTFKSKFIENLFAKNYLAISKPDGSIIKVNENSPDVKREINDPANVNGATSGQRNSFKFDAKADGSTPNDIDFAYADFISFVFDKWVKETVPVLTPSILFKNESDPKGSLLFNDNFFGSAIGDQGSYKFQYFSKNNQDYENPNASLLYSTFIQNKTKYVNDALGGSIDIDNTLTQDSSTKLTSVISTNFDTFVAPYAAAGSYKFFNLAFNQNDPNVPTSADFNNTSIMNNFVVKQQNINDKGVFKFPYLNNNEDPFLNDYAGMKGIKDTVNITNTPWIITRNEFGVHIIGIDRYKAIKEASAKGKDSVFNELENTILWREAQDRSYAAGNQIDLQQKLKDYTNNNLSRLLLEYAISSTSTGNNNLFTGSWMNKPWDLKTQIPQYYVDLINAAKNLLVYSTLEQRKNTIKDKIYGLQDSYSSTKASGKWKEFGIAGCLPYSIDTKSGNFTYLDNGYNILFDNLVTDFNNSSDAAVDANYEKAKTTYLAAMNNFITQAKVEPANDYNYFNKHPKAGVSQAVITNIPFINKIMLLANSSQVENDIFYQEKYKEELGQIWDFNKDQFSGTNGQIPPAPSVNDQTADFTQLNSWILSNLQQAFEEEKVLTDFAKSLGSLYSKGNWTDYNSLLTLAKNNRLSNINKNKYTKDNSDFIINYQSDYGSTTFIKTLAWLLSWDKDSKTFSFKNLKDILKDSISTNKIGYVAWTNSNYVYAKNNYGLSGVADQNKISTQMQSDTKFYNLPYYLTKLNPYSYIGAPNAFDPSQTQNVYWGTNDNYYSVADVSSTVKQATGFLGFQAQGSSLMTNNLPEDLYSLKLFSQNTSNPNANFKGVFYNYNTDNNPTNARNNLINYIKNNVSEFEIGNLANKIINIGFNFTKDNLLKLNEVKIGVDKNGNRLTLEQRKNELSTIINDTNLIPNQAFEPLRGEYLWNNNTTDGNSTTIFTDKNKKGFQQQYIVSQFNDSDIDNLVFYNATTKKSFLNPTKLLGLQPGTFFKAIVKLCMNGEVQSRANSAWTDYFNKTQYIVYDKNLAKTLGEAIVKNWKDFN